MALEQKLALKLAQKLVMTPSLQQAIKLLQMTRIELEGALTAELVENPVLEENEPTSDERAEVVEETPDAEADPMGEIDLEAYFSDYAESWEGRGNASVFEEREGPPLENILTRQPDLYDHLLWQLHMMDVTPLQRELAELIIGNLDTEGFFTATVEEIMRMGAPPDAADDVAIAADLGLPLPEPSVPEPASVEVEPAGGIFAGRDLAPTDSDVTTDAHELGDLDVYEHDDEDVIEPDPPGYPRAEVEAALELVRNLDPPGVACATLQESLLRQLDARDEPEDSPVRRLIADYWELLKKRKFEAIAKAMGTSLAELKPAVDAIRGLETRPGQEYSTDRAQYVEPDVQVVRVGDQYVVQLNDDGLPRLRVSKAYRRLLQQMRSEGRQNDAQQFIQEKMRSALWLIKSLDQRQRTIYKVTKSIVRQQQGFLDHGIEHLRPMVLRDVADDIGMHESTVSRVVSNKYVHTPRGLFPLKFFFHSGIDREYGGDISSLTVKRKIQHLVQDEDPRKPLSDSELMRILKREGIQIARRTVAKYRDELRIPSSTDRKQIF